jgi:ubiquinol-cytochrome c reductase cytochrome c1 subunit
MEERKRMGLVVLAFLVVLAGLLYLSYKQVWRNESH